MVHTPTPTLSLKMSELDEVAKPLTGFLVAGDYEAISQQLVEIRIRAAELLDYANTADLSREIEPFQQYVLINVQNTLEATAEACLGRADDLRSQTRAIMDQIKSVLGLMLIYV